MKHSGTTAAFCAPTPTEGYDWDDKKGDFEATPFIDVDNMAPAGAVVSTVSDMARWVRFLLARGEFEGKRLVEAREFDELWSDDDDLVPNYGQGWFLHPGDAEIAAENAAKSKDAKHQGLIADPQCWRAPDGKRHLVIEHGGNVPGFSAEVGLLPEYRLGLVMLSNVSASQLQASILDLVWNAMLGPWKERRKIEEGAPLAEAATKSWLGAYTEGRVGVPPRALQRVSDRLVLIVPPALGQVAVASFTLSWPAADGRFWLREESDAYLTIDRDDKGGVQALTLVRNGDSFRMTPLPTAAPPAPPEQSVEELEAARLGSGGQRGREVDPAHRHDELPQAGTPALRSSRRARPHGIDYDVARSATRRRSSTPPGWQENHFNGFKVLGASEARLLCATRSSSRAGIIRKSAVVGIVMVSAPDSAAAALFDPGVPASRGPPHERGA